MIENNDLFSWSWWKKNRFSTWAHVEKNGFVFDRRAVDFPFQCQTGIPKHKITMCSTTSHEDNRCLPYTHAAREKNQAIIWMELTWQALSYASPGRDTHRVHCYGIWMDTAGKPNQICRISQPISSKIFAFVKKFEIRSTNLTPAGSLVSWVKMCRPVSMAVSSSGPPGGLLKTFSTFTARKLAAAQMTPCIHL